MYISNHMSSPPVTIKVDLPISDARELLQSHQFRHLPVVDSGKQLVGMVTDRDIRSSYPSSVFLAEEERKKYLDELKNTSVSTIMTESIVTLTAMSTLDDALLLIDSNNVGALPVLDGERRVIGILSIRDLMKAYRNLFGLGEHGSAMIVVDDDGNPKPLTRIANVMEEYDIRFTRLIRAKEEGDLGNNNKIYIRVHTYNLSAVHAALKEANFKTALPQITR